MAASDKCSPELRERNYKCKQGHRQTYQVLVSKIGMKFTEKEGHSNTEQPSFEDLLLWLDKYEVFLPQLSMEAIDVIINMLSPIGNNLINHNYLALFRYFHSLKYR